MHGDGPTMIGRTESGFTGVTPTAPVPGGRGGCPEPADYVTKLNAGVRSLPARRVVQDGRDGTILGRPPAESPPELGGADVISILLDLASEVRAIRAALDNRPGDPVPTDTGVRVRRRRPEGHRPSRATGKAVGTDSLPQMFAELLVSGNSVATSIDELVRNGGHAVSPDRSHRDGRIPAVGALTAIFYAEPDRPWLLADTLEATEAFGTGPDARTSGVLCGIAAYLSLRAAVPVPQLVKEVQMSAIPVSQARATDDAQRKVAVAAYLNRCVAAGHPNLMFSDEVIRTAAARFVPAAGAAMIRAGLPDPRTQ